MDRQVAAFNWHLTKNGLNRQAGRPAKLVVRKQRLFDDTIPVQLWGLRIQTQRALTVGSF